MIGKVVDPDKKPLEGVVVTITTPEISSFKEVKKTDRRGTFTVDFRHIDITYTYRFEKDGFQTMEVQQEWHLEGTQRVEWTMMPGSSGPTAGPLPTTSQPAVVAYNAGLAALKAKDYATAETKFSEAVGHDPNLLQGWIALTSIHMQTGKNKEAAAAAEKAIALGSTDSAILTARYQAYRNMKDEAKAAEALKDLETIGRRAEEAKKIHNEAVALVKAKDSRAAFAKFQEALKVDPNLQASLIGLATAGLQIGKNEEAATAAETVLKTDPGNEQAIRLRYNACLALGDKDRLAEALVGLAAVEPEVARNGLLKLAFDAFDANDMPKARAAFLNVLKVDPNQPQANYYLAMVLINSGETAEARKYLEKFISLAPNTPEAATAKEMLKQIK
ncbi:MAG: tetratricopeptide repeat protein [Vicinamibacterales bacterium]